MFQRLDSRRPHCQRHRRALLFSPCLAHAGDKTTEPTLVLRHNTAPPKVNISGRMPGFESEEADHDVFCPVWQQAFCCVCAPGGATPSEFTRSCRKYNGPRNLFERNFLKCILKVPSFCGTRGYNDFSVAVLGVVFSAGDFRDYFPRFLAFSRPTQPLAGKAVTATTAVLAAGGAGKNRSRLLTRSQTYG